MPCFDIGDRGVESSEEGVGALHSAETDTAIAAVAPLPQDI